MKKHFFLIASLSLLLTSCDRNYTATHNNSNTPNADNTERNVRDRNAQTLTSGDQLENEADRTITQRIRQAVVDDSALSTYAKNVKIITVNGVVTLRGPVNNEREKNDIAQKAQAVSGVRSVDNQLEIVRNNNAQPNGMTQDVRR